MKLTQGGKSKTSSISKLFEVREEYTGVQGRDAPVPVPDWVTGYQSDRSPSRTGYPVRLVPSPDWVSLTSKYINSF